jgi:hypothetical protein
MLRRMVLTADAPAAVARSFRALFQTAEARVAA